ncbi:outer membrane protein assembly factor BamB family protein [Limnoglobus roseus]|uniref:Serine/threonine protein kinase n=1 Tax=Limnoglobus roseus TaxID=2598579 RepID=A0A5C1ANV5_9BACT|nr:PQQ-binding-like beta-propeller repeat protein [Limnoglobus roseus]QEL20265.1 serine/threonine protein kinase [Limnoglobus roseus]
MRRFHLLSLAAILAAGAALPAADWTRFRGPNGDGIAADAIPVKWSPKENIVWSQELPGPGNSSPIVVKGKIFLEAATRDGSKRSLVCLDAQTGKPTWEKTFGGQPAKIHAKSSLASCTPTSDGTFVYAAVWDGREITVHAFDFAGEQKWERKLGKFESQHGAGLSPIVHDGRVFINFDQDGSAEIVALDAKTGDKAWGVSRKAFRACYSTPIVRKTAAGKDEIVVFSTAGAAGYDPKTGGVNWSWTIPWQAGEMALRSVASPVLAKDTLVCLTGDGSGSRYGAAVTITGTKTSLNWEKRSANLMPYVPCPVVKGDYLYWVTDQGVVECLETKSGKVQWSERVLNKSVSASPVLVGDNLVIIDEAGKSVVVKADPKEFEKLGEGSVGEPVFASPAVADGKLYIRGSSHLFCIQGKGT